MLGLLLLRVLLLLMLMLLGERLPVVLLHELLSIVMMYGSILLDSYSLLVGPVQLLQATVAAVGRGRYRSCRSRVPEREVQKRADRLMLVLAATILLARLLQPVVAVRSPAHLLAATCFLRRLLAGGAARRQTSRLLVALLTSILAAHRLAAWLCGLICFR